MTQPRTQYEIVLTQSSKLINKENFSQPKQQYEHKSKIIQKGSSFWSIEDDYKTIYSNFNLLSYFSPSREVKILNRVERNKETKKKAFDEFRIRYGSSYLMIQQQKDDIQNLAIQNLQKRELQIKYSVAKKQSDNDDLKQQNKVCSLKVLFKVESRYMSDIKKTFLHRVNSEVINDNCCWMIVIKIQDKSGWISKNFSDVQIKADNHRISQIRKPSTKEIQYFYKQPQNKRNYEVDYDHFSLALQGGGCKGVQFIGAYQAILQRKKPIKSIIGSSAGGIIGLAICCSLSPDQIIQLCRQKLSKVTDDKYKTIREDDEKIMQNSYKKIKKVLLQINILDQYIVNMLTSLFQDKQFHRLVLKLLKEATNPQIYKLFYDQENGVENLNLVGFLNAALMTGNKIHDIAAEVLRIYFKKRMDNKDQKLFLKYPQLKSNKLQSMQEKNQLMKICQKITLLQLYELTEIQFTCTAVDLNSHILRFFNQKTTPHLPACKAVQMTGSFPVAFQAQQWKPQWGKYYIHYDNIRRQVNIQGHKFTDGGTLSNFPIKYLDNQDMRPMYFSHPKNKKTEIYGIGFQSYAQKDEQKSKKINQVANQIAVLASSKVSKLRALWQWAFGSRPQQVQTSISPSDFRKLKDQIPLFSFIRNLLDTFNKTKDHLIEECFSHISFDINVGSLYKAQLEQSKQNIGSISKKLSNISGNISKLLTPAENNFASIYQIFKENLSYLGAGAQHLGFYEQGLFYMQKILHSNIESLFYYLMDGKGSEIKDRIDQNLKIILKQRSLLRNDQTNKPSLIVILQKLKQIKKQKTFVLCDIQKDYNTLREICELLKTTIQDLRRQKDWSAIIQQAFIKARNRQYRVLQQLRYLFQQFSNNYYQAGKRPGYIKKIIQAASRLPIMTLTFRIPQIKQVLKSLKIEEVRELCVNYETQTEKNNFKAYILKRINNQNQHEGKHNFDVDSEDYQQLEELSRLMKQKGIHIVLQSSAYSQLYFHKYFMAMKSTLIKYNEESRNPDDIESEQALKNLRVSTITVTGYQSLIAFLHASDLSDSEIQQQVWKIRDLVKIDPQKLKRRFQNTDWLKITPLLLRQISQRGAKQKDIFAFIESDILEKKQYSSLRQQIQKLIGKTELNKQEFNQTIETSLNFVMNVLIEIDQSQDKSKQKIDQLIKNLALNTQQNKMRYQLQQYQQNLKELSQFFFQKYKDLIKYMSFNFPFMIQDAMKILSRSDRRQLWKGILMSYLLCKKTIKNYVKSILQRLMLKPDTTLQQFYEISSKKIQINFSVVQHSLVSILNQFTRPNMPIWAAVLAASLIPQFYKPILDRQSWRQKYDQDYSLRKVKSYFSQQQNPYRFLFSSAALTKMPLDLLQNNSFQKRIKKQPKFQEIFIVFNFEDFQFQNIDNLMFQNDKQRQKRKEYQFKVTPLTLKEAMQKFVSFKQIIKKNIQTQQKNNRQALKLLPSISTFTSKSKLMQLYINSHDNLIKGLYKRQLVLMPVRFETLDFHKIPYRGRSEQNQQKLSNLCQDAIMQAKYAVKQKMENKYPKSVINIFGSMMPIEKSTGYQEEIVLGKQLFEKQSQRVLYFRIQPVDKENIKIRFLSLLNPSREIYEQYFAYYLKFDESNPQKSTYIKVKQEDVVLSKNIFKKLSLKVEYPEFVGKHVQCKYFELDLSPLFSLNGILLQQGKQLRYGLVYRLNFDVLYSDFNRSTELLPVNQEDYDYMNNIIQREKEKEKYFVKIKIVSDVKGTVYSSYICQKCVLPYRLIKKNSKTNIKQHDAYLQCPNPNCSLPPYFLSSKYKLFFDRKKNGFKCLMNHDLKKKQITEKDGEIKFSTCDLCGKGCMSYVWRDQCGISICQDCRLNFKGIQQI